METKAPPLDPLSVACAEMAGRWLEQREGPRKYALFMRWVLARLDESLRPLYAYNDIGPLLRAAADEHTAAICAGVRSGSPDSTPGLWYVPALRYRQEVIGDLGDRGVHGAHGHLYMLRAALDVAADSLRLDPGDLLHQVQQVQYVLAYARHDVPGPRVWAGWAEALAWALIRADGQTLAPHEQTTASR